MRRLTLIVLTVFALSLPAHADQLQDADRAYSHGGYAAAFKLLLPLAEHGNPKAQDRLGWMFEGGDGIRKPNYAEAMKRFRKAADGGDADALWAIGSMYDNGEGIQKSRAKALKWWSRAAEQGSGISQQILADVYKDGAGLPQSWPQAYFWYAISQYETFSNSEDVVNAAKHLTAEQKAEVDRHVTEWKKTHHGLWSKP
jgi:TPR repeat protein